MIDRRTRGGERKLGVCVRRGLTGVLLGLCGVVAANDEAYLKALDAEVEKVAADTAEPVLPVALEPNGKAPAVTATREDFESQMRQENIGTYSFYRRLPERSRQEVFADYQNGASISDLRDKIVDRFLQR